MALLKAPIRLLQLAQTNSQPNDVIYVFPGDGTTKGMDQGITLQDNQRFWGSGTDQLLSTQFGLITIPAQTTKVPQITSLAGQAVILARNNEVSSFSIQRPFQEGIAGTSVGNLTIKNTLVFASQNTNGITLAETGTTPIKINVDKIELISNLGNDLNFTADPNTQVDFSVTNSIVRQNGSNSPFTSNGLFFNSFGAIKNTFENNLIENTGFRGILVNNASQEALILKNNLIKANRFGVLELFGQQGLEVQKIIIENNVIENNSSGGIVITALDNPPQFEFVCKENQFQLNAQQQLSIVSSGIQSNISIHDNIFQNGGFDGVDINSPLNATLSIKNNIVDGHVKNGMNILVANATVNIENNVIKNTSAGTGILLLSQAGPDQTTSAQIQNNLVENNFTSGLNPNFQLTGATSWNLNIADNKINRNGIGALLQFSDMNVAVPVTGVCTISNNEFIRNNGTGLSEIIGIDTDFQLVTVLSRINNNTFIANSFYGVSLESGPLGKSTAALSKNTFSENVPSDGGFRALNDAPTSFSCTTLLDNSSDTGYLFNNASNGTMNFAPLNAVELNKGPINTEEVVNAVPDCP